MIREDASSVAQLVWPYINGIRCELDATLIDTNHSNHRLGGIVLLVFHLLLIFFLTFSQSGSVALI